MDELKGKLGDYFGTIKYDAVDPASGKAHQVQLLLKPGVDAVEARKALIKFNRDLLPGVRDKFQADTRAAEAYLSGAQIADTISDSPAQLAEAKGGYFLEFKMTVPVVPSPAAAPALAGPAPLPAELLVAQRHLITAFADRVDASALLTKSADDTYTIKINLGDEAHLAAGMQRAQTLFPKLELGPPILDPERITVDIDDATKQGKVIIKLKGNVKGPSRQYENAIKEELNRMGLLNRADFEKVRIKMKKPENTEVEQIEFPYNTTYMAKVPTFDRWDVDDAFKISGKPVDRMGLRTAIDAEKDRHRELHKSRTWKDVSIVQFDTGVPGDQRWKLKVIIPCDASNVAARLASLGKLYPGGR